MLYTAAITFIILKLVNSLVGLRVSDEVEVEGLDTAEHDERAYIL